MSEQLPRPSRPFSRRQFLSTTGLIVGGLAVGATFTQCADDDSPTPPTPMDVGFFHGVASFDPTQNQVILWTRFSPGSLGVIQRRIPIRYQISKNPNFTGRKMTGVVFAEQRNDFTVSLDVSSLDPGTKFYYKFLARGVESIVGETYTLPNNTSSVKLAVCSCSNYPAGLFNVYGAIAESDADVVIHLGDYIYEYALGQYGTNETTTALGREPDPITEILTLQDYRARYRQYRSDPQLQAAHSKKPFICVWDDHEFTNDAWVNGAENHDPSEGNWADRKAIAYQVYSEYLPFRTDDITKIYRSFQFGNLVNLVMLDTRIEGRSEQLSFGNYFDPKTGQFDVPAFQTDWLDPTRSLLGPEQLNWAIGEVTGSSATWQVLGQQVLMGKMNVPFELLSLIALIAGGNVSPEIIAQFQQLLGELVTIKARILAGDPTVTPEERARVETVLPYNLDAWDGYPIEREILLNSIGDCNLAVLAGDTHNGWQSQLTTQTGRVAGNEFATPSVTSPGFEQLFGTDPQVIAGFEQSLQILIDDLNYLDAARRGYLSVEFTPGNVVAEWNFISTIASLNTSTIIGNTITANCSMMSKLAKDKAPTMA
ncbi:MAG: alkaline phosphatase D family protein [Saprospiraceae bacterium]|nr:alkaline phosphatase D family protein [Saprospiraceae bacterium]